MKASFLCAVYSNSILRLKKYYKKVLKLDNFFCARRKEIKDQWMTLMTQTITGVFLFILLVYQRYGCHDIRSTKLE